MLKAVIFDLDGVIVSTDIYHYEAWKALTDRKGLEFNFEINDRLRGISRAESLQIILDVNQKTIGQREFNRIAGAKNRRYRRLLGKLKPEDMLPGVKDLIADLRQSGIKTAVGSSSRNTPKILKRLKLTKAFDAVVDGNAGLKSKPDPAIFLACAVALGEAPESCLVIEDAEAGIAAAKAAGMTALGVGKTPLSSADRMLASLLGENAAKLAAIHDAAKRTAKG